MYQRKCDLRREIIGSGEILKILIAITLMGAPAILAFAPAAAASPGCDSAVYPVPISSPLRPVPLGGLVAQEGGCVQQKRLSKVPNYHFFNSFWPRFSLLMKTPAFTVESAHVWPKEGREPIISRSFVRCIPDSGFLSRHPEHGHYTRRCMCRTSYGHTPVCGPAFQTPQYRQLPRYRHACRAIRVCPYPGPGVH